MSPSPDLLPSAGALAEERRAPPSCMTKPPIELVSDSPAPSRHLHGDFFLLVRLECLEK